MQEFQHSTLHASGQFRLTEVNAAFKMSDSYPTSFVVPRVVSDDELMVIGSYRSRGRVPGKILNAEHRACIYMALA